MNDCKENNISKCLFPGDPRACILLGAQKKPAEDKNIRRSCFVYVLYMKGQYLLFHTLTRKILLLEPKYIDYFAGDRLFPPSVLEKEILAKLYEDHFLVPEDEQERRWRIHCGSSRGINRQVRKRSIFTGSAESHCVHGTTLTASAQD